MSDTHIPNASCQKGNGSHDGEPANTENRAVCTKISKINDVENLCQSGIVRESTFSPSLREAEGLSGGKAGEYGLALIGEKVRWFAEADEMLAALYERYPHGVFSSQDGTRDELLVWAREGDMLADSKRSGEFGAHVVGSIRIGGGL
jgi:hypothetical protein